MHLSVQSLKSKVLDTAPCHVQLDDPAEASQQRRLSHQGVRPEEVTLQPEMVAHVVDALFDKCAPLLHLSTDPLTHSFTRTAHFTETTSGRVVFIALKDNSSGTIRL